MIAFTFGSHSQTVRLGRLMGTTRHGQKHQRLHPCERLRHAWLGLAFSPGERDAYRDTARIAYLSITEWIHFGPYSVLRCTFPCSVCSGIGLPCHVHKNSAKSPLLRKTGKFLGNLEERALFLRLQLRGGLVSFVPSHPFNPFSLV